jgi:hypothetical protein
MGSGSFPGVKSGRGVTLNSHLLLVPSSRKDRTIPLLPYGPYGLYKGALYLYLYLRHPDDGREYDQSTLVTINI